MPAKTITLPSLKAPSIHSLTYSFDLTPAQWNLHLSKALMFLVGEYVFTAAEKQIASDPSKTWTHAMKLSFYSLIIREARTMGVVMNFCILVQTSIVEWKTLPNGLKLLRAYHKAVEESFAIQQGKRAPLDPFLKNHKDKAVPELKIVLADLRMEFRKLGPNQAIKPEQLIEKFFAAVKGTGTEVDVADGVTFRPLKFPWLFENRDLWQQFIQREPEEFQGAIFSRVTAEGLFLTFAEHRTKFNRDYLQQKLYGR